MSKKIIPLQLKGFEPYLSKIDTDLNHIIEWDLYRYFQDEKEVNREIYLIVEIIEGERQ